MPCSGSCPTGSPKLGRRQLFVVGGAAMALAYDVDRLTRDVDALFFPALWCAGSPKR